MKRTLSVLLSFIFICSLFTGIDIQSVGAITKSEFDNKISALRSEFPNYSEWHSSFSGAIECCGFAYLLGYRVYGTVPNTWTKVYNMNNVKSGDVIQYGNANTSGHTIFVTGVSGDTITFVDCNANGNYSGANKVRTCGIKWDNTVEKNRPLFGYNFSYVLSSPDLEDGYFDLWGYDISKVQNVNGITKIWFKAVNLNYHSSDVNVYINNICIGTIYPDESGFYSIDIDTSKYSNGEHTINAVFRNTLGVEKWSSTLHINIQNPMFVIWDIPQSEVEGDVKVWFKILNCEYKNSSAKLYIDSEYINTMYPDENGFFSYVINSNSLTNGYHEIKATFANDLGINLSTDVKKLLINNLCFFGDANDDGDVNIQDATIVQMVVAKYPVEKINEKLADYDQNGEINIRDATSIQMIVAKLV